VSGIGFKRPRNLHQCGLLIDAVADFLDELAPNKPYFNFIIPTGSRDQPWRIWPAGVTSEHTMQIQKDRMVDDDLGHNPDAEHLSSEEE